MRWSLRKLQWIRSTLRRGREPIGQATEGRWQPQMHDVTLTDRLQPPKSDRAATFNKSNHMTQLSIVVPTFNERHNIEPLLMELRQALSGLDWECVVVDDDSPDGTAELVRSIAQTEPRIRVIQRIGRRGLSSACIEGMLSTSSPILAVMDGDLQHDPATIPLLLAEIEKGADIAVATRASEGGLDSMTYWRRLMQRIRRESQPRRPQAQFERPDERVLRFAAGGVYAVCRPTFRRRLQNPSRSDPVGTR